ncbi:hypothetical protein [Dokdonia sp.]|uniref:hypothetical protein n=1 Tax=Dokdonia sp. TaxID=2024995 RepID=UPI003262E45D
MKTTFLILALAFSTLVVAQRPSKEQIKSLKIAFITERLDLSTKEAQVFWPIYNDYDKSMQKLRRQERKLLTDLKENFKTISEKEGDTALSTLSKFGQDKLDIRESLVTQLKNVISSKKILTLLKAEEDFKHNLIRKLGGRKGRGGPRSNSPNGGK